MRAIKKPIPIDAHEFTGSITQLEDWMNSLGDGFNDHFIDGEDSISVKTLEGTSYQVIPHKHVIIRGVKGEYYPCDKDIFYETYEIINS